MIKYIAYCRKSTDEPDRQILSIEAQVAELEEFTCISYPMCISYCISGTTFSYWLSVLNKIRTFFRENPDADF